MAACTNYIIAEESAENIYIATESDFKALSDVFFGSFV